MSGGSTIGHLPNGAPALSSDMIGIERPGSPNNANYKLTLEDVTTLIENALASIYAPTSAAYLMIGTVPESLPDANQFEVSSDFNLTTAANVSTLSLAAAISSTAKFNFMVNGGASPNITQLNLTAGANITLTPTTPSSGILQVAIAATGTGINAQGSVIAGYPLKWVSSTLVQNGTVNSKTWYVDSINGNDSNSGLSINDPFATIQKALSVSTDDAYGDTIYLAKGFLVNGSAIAITKSANIVSLGNSLNESARFGNATIITITGKSNMSVSFTGCSFVALNNIPIIINNAGSGPTGVAVNLQNCKFNFSYNSGYAQTTAAQIQINGQCSLIGNNNFFAGTAAGTTTLTRNMQIQITGSSQVNISLNNTRYYINRFTNGVADTFLYSTNTAVQSSVQINGFYHQDQNSQNAATISDVFMLDTGAAHSIDIIDYNFQEAYQVSSSASPILRLANSNNAAANTHIAISNALIDWGSLANANIALANATASNDNIFVVNGTFKTNGTYQPATSGSGNIVYSFIDGGGNGYGPFAATINNFNGIVYVDSVNGNDSNTGKNSWSPVQTLARAFVLAQNGYVIWIAPGSNFPTFNISVMAQVTLYSPMIGTIEGGVGSGAQGQPSLGGTFTITDNGSTSTSTGRLYCYNLNFAATSNTTGFSYAILNGVLFEPDFYAFNCYFNTQTSGSSIAANTVVSCIKNLNGRLNLQNCFFSIIRNDSAASGRAALVYITGSAWCSSFIKNNRLNVIHGNNNFNSSAIYSDNTNSTTIQSLCQTENNSVTLSYAGGNNCSYISKNSDKTVIQSSKDSVYLTKSTTITKAVLLLSLNSTGSLEANDISCDYGTFYQQVFTDSSVYLAQTSTSTDLIKATGYMNTSANVAPNIDNTGGINTIQFSVINGALKKIGSSQYINDQSGGTTYTLTTADFGDGSYVKVNGGPLTLTPSASMLPTSGGANVSVYATVANTSASPCTVTPSGSDVLHGTATIPGNGVTRIYYEGIIGGNGSYRIG